MTKLIPAVTTREATAGSRRPGLTRVGGRLGALAVLLAVSTTMASGPVGAAAGSSNWTSYLFNTHHSSYNFAATSIRTGNLDRLQPVWNWVQPKSSNPAIWASPTVYNGVVYIGVESGYFYAVSESTHAVLWSIFMGTTPATAECGKSLGITSTAVVAHNAITGETVYVNAPNGQLYALNASNGAVIWHSTVDTPSTTEDDYYAWSSPLVANGHVYVGISSNCDEPLVRAGMLEFHQATGALQATWHAEPGALTGASVWGTPATSTLGDGSIFATTGNAEGASQPLYGESIVRLSGRHLTLLDHWQVPPSQRIGDGDFGGSPTDFTADLDGTSTHMVGAVNKNGLYYAFRQDDLAAGPVWAWRMSAPSSAGNATSVAAAVWDGIQLIEGGGNSTTINGTTYPGSVQSLNPATGTPFWQTGLPGRVLGSPTEDGSGVVAAPVFESGTGDLGVYLLNASTGAILDFISTDPSPIFAQPVFAGNDLLVAGDRATGLTDYKITKPGPPIAGVAPDAIGQGGAKTVTLTGRGFSRTPSVFVSGTLVSGSSVAVKSSTELQVRLSAAAYAATGSRNITVIEPGSTADTCSGCLTIDPAPAVSKLSPDSLAPGTTTQLTVTGSGLASGLTVTTTIPGATVGTPSNVTSTSFTAEVTAPANAAAGNYQLKVTNPDGGTGSAALSVA
jgi:outer membrane protein assembly factor BamB